jgi:chemotaxis family two-component system response regulator Rcp1
MADCEKKKPRVLIVEDNPGDVRLMTEALRENGREYEITVAPDGAAATDYLFQRGPNGGRGVPDLIFLDLNLPKKSGREVLEEIKADEKLKTIPVVIFSTSSAPQDIRRAYELHANCYVTKPADLDELFQAIGCIEKFWLKAAKLPTAPRG